MARITLTSDPVDLIATVSTLAAGTTYVIQAEVNGHSVAHLDDGTAKPTDLNIGWKIPNLGAVRASGNNLWAWSLGVDSDVPGYLNVFVEP